MALRRLDAGLDDANCAVDVCAKEPHVMGNAEVRIPALVGSPQSDFVLDCRCAAPMLICSAWASKRSRCARCPSRTVVPRCGSE
jgi:hypothetical protein